MQDDALPTNRLDRIAMGLSGLCVVHCIGTALLVGLLASAGGILGSPVIHEVGLTIAMMIGAFALGRGVREHGLMLPAAVGAVKPGTSAIGTTAVGGPSSSTAGAQPDPSTIATSWSATPVRWAITDAASSAIRVGSADGTIAA